MASNPCDHRKILKTLSHDLGNLAYRLTFLSASLKTQIPHEGDRSDAVALLEDTTARMHQIIARLREVERDA